MLLTGNTACPIPTLPINATQKYARRLHALGPLAAAARLGEHQSITSVATTTGPIPHNLGRWDGGKLRSSHRRM